MRIIALNDFLGHNPFRFLAALGLTSALHRAQPDWHVALGWERHNLRWRARLRIPDLSDAEFVEATVGTLLESARRFDGYALCPELQVEDKETDIQGIANNRANYRSMAARGTALSDYLTRVVAENETEPSLAISNLILVRGAGGQRFLPACFGLSVRLGVHPEDDDRLKNKLPRYDRQHAAERVRRTLFEPWRVQDQASSTRDGCTLKLDPAMGARDSALIGDPNDMEMLTERAAEVMAVEALPLFPVFPGHKSVTRSVHKEAEKTVFTWPLWSAHLSVDEIKVMLSVARLDPAKQKALGICTTASAHFIIKDKARLLAYL